MNRNLRWPSRGTTNVASGDMGFSFNNLHFTYYPVMVDAILSPIYIARHKTSVDCNPLRLSPFVKAICWANLNTFGNYYVIGEAHEIVPKLRMFKSCGYMRSIQ